jgi:hypothetical protein
VSVIPVCSLNSIYAPRPTEVGHPCPHKPDIDVILYGKRNSGPAGPQSIPGFRCPKFAKLPFLFAFKGRPERGVYSRPDAETFSLQRCDFDGRSTFRCLDARRRNHSGRSLNANWQFRKILTALLLARRWAPGDVLLIVRVECQHTRGPAQTQLLASPFGRDLNGTFVELWAQGPGTGHAPWVAHGVPYPCKGSRPPPAPPTRPSDGTSGM